MATVKMISLDLTDLEISACIQLCEREWRRTENEFYRKVADQLVAYYEDARHVDWVDESWLRQNRLSLPDRLYETRDGD